MVNHRRSLKRNRSTEAAPLSTTNVNAPDAVFPSKVETGDRDSHHLCEPSDKCENCAPQIELNEMLVTVSDSKSCSVEENSKKRMSRSKANPAIIQAGQKHAKVNQRFDDTSKTCEETASHKRPKVSDPVDSITNTSGETICPMSSLQEKTGAHSNSLPMLSSTPTSQSDIVKSKLTTSANRLSLKSRKDDSVAPIFKQTSASKKSVLERVSTGEPCYGASDLSSALSSTTPVFSIAAAAPGLVNLGNTCFFNSIVQTLFYTPAFVDSVALLVTEISATTRDNDAIASLKKSSVSPVSQFPCWKFVERLHEVMKKAVDRFASGRADVEPIGPNAVLTQLEAMNSMFSGGLQQDAHELLRCILSYVQDSVKLLNKHRSTLSAAVEADRLENSAKNAEPKTCAAAKNRKSDGDECGEKAEKKSKRRRSSSNSVSLSEPAESSGATSVGRITKFFLPAGPKPKSISEIALKTHLLADFVEEAFEGLVERRTRCLECERVTKCSEVFQDVEVVVQKKATEQVDKENQEAGNESCWIVESLVEIERLRDENKYWCTECDHHVEAERSIEFHRVPEILTIQMKRFSAFSSGFYGVYVKTMDCVTVPFEMQCLEKQCRDATHQPSHRYELFVVLSHTGVSLSSGHYIAYVRCLADDARLIETVAAAAASSSSGEVEETKSVSTTIVSCSLGPWWYVCDDETVTAMTQTELERKLSAGGSSTPYLLLYRRRHVTRTI